MQQLPGQMQRPVASEYEPERALGVAGGFESSASSFEIAQSWLPICSSNPEGPTRPVWPRGLSKARLNCLARRSIAVS
ncbi:MAG: hypothetical protein CMJ48_12645 [Planctomycetaceae bacterium]|nr:hypothetical protein [Planctomycetaceae bacterium]